MRDSSSLAHERNRCLVSIPPELMRPDTHRQPSVHPLKLTVAYDIWISFIILSALTASIFFFPHQSNAVRFGLGLAIGLFVPGYLSTLVLFPNPKSLDGIERTGLSLVLSVVWIPLLALFLSLAKLRLDATHLVLAVNLVCLLMGSSGLIRRSASGIQSPPPVYPSGKVGLYLGSLVVGLGVLTWAIVAPNLKTQHLAFAVLGRHQQLSGYPFQVRIGERYPLIVEIQNPRSHRGSYKVDLVANGAPTQTLHAHVAAQRSWKTIMALPANRPARSETARFLLFRGRSTKPLRTLWIRYTIVP